MGCRARVLAMVAVEPVMVVAAVLVPGAPAGEAQWAPDGLALEAAP